MNRSTQLPADAVLFDLDDTLLDTEAGWAAGMDSILGRCPYVDRAAAFAAWSVAFDAHYDRLLRGELTFDECCIARIRTWAQQLSIDVALGDELCWFADYSAGYRDGSTAFPDVHECLQSLQGRKLGIVTNGDSAQQRAKLKQVGLDDRFDVFLASSDVGFPKPDKRIFETAAARLGVAPHRCVFVGDRYDVDAAGAAAAGMRGIWLNRAGAQSATPERVDGVIEIDSLALIPNLLGLA